MDQNQIDRLEGKVDKLHEKLDCHLERIAKAEVWIKGHTTVLTLLFTGIITFIGIIIGK